MSREIELDTVFQSGTHKGLQAWEVAHVDPDYIRWLHRETLFEVSEDVLLEAQLEYERRWSSGQCKNCDD